APATTRNVMKIIRTIHEMHEAVTALKREGRTIGFVPTMGFLHEGHLSLMRLARERADVLAASIFVNPMQFGPHEDYQDYPRDFERDEALCEGESVDLLFYPPADELYPGDRTVFVDEESITTDYEGECREGHFRGVLTVVAKLFNIMQPDVSVFGQKDAQQLSVVRRMVRDLNFPIEIVAGPTVREPDGLAMSSRNTYLSPDQRAQALCLRKSLDLAETLIAEGEPDPQNIKQAMTELIAGHDLAKLDYLDIVDAASFEPLEEIGSNALAILVVRFGATRLLDNQPL
ncbi:MAG: pantoate--beta-alanine ligase, partial [Verrucomicrobiota bacterium]